MSKKAVSLFIVVLMVLSAIPVAMPVAFVSADVASISQIKPDFSLTQGTQELQKPYIPKSVINAFVKAKTMGWKAVPLVVLLRPEYTFDDLKREGFNVISEFDYIHMATIAVDINDLNKLYKSKVIARVWVDQIYKIEPPKPRIGVKKDFNYFIGKYTVELNATEAQGLANISVETTYAKQMWELDFDGRNVTVAVIDTGVDPGHPDLLYTTDGKPKIVDYVDLSNWPLLSLVQGLPYKLTSGWVNTSATSEAVNGTIVYMNMTFILPTDATSKSGVYHIGHIEEWGVELDGDWYNNPDYDPYDGKHYDPWAGAILVIDNETPGVYNLVYVDTDNDGSFADEKPLTVYRTSPGPQNVGSWVWNETLGQMKNFVISDLDPNGTWVVLGYDMGDHGTHVAGTIAANGFIKGMAPGAQLMVIKVGTDFLGYISTSSLIQAFLYAALGHDGVPNSGDEADIISMSIGAQPVFQVGDDPDDLVLNWVADQFNIPFSISAGNEGPGVNTVGSPSVAFNAISVGAALEKARMEWLNQHVVLTSEYQSLCLICNLTINGFPVNNINDYATVATFSSRGPNEVGQLKPTILAPGANVMSLLPLTEINTEWSEPPYNSIPYQYMSGTSMAAPHVGGALALLIHAYKETYGVKPTVDMLRDSLIRGAIPLNQSVVDQGAGFLNVTGAWNILKTFDTLEDSPLLYSGYYARDSEARESIQEALDLVIEPFYLFPFPIDWSYNFTIPANWPYNFTFDVLNWKFQVGTLTFDYLYADIPQYNAPFGFITIYNPSDKNITIDIYPTGELAPYIYMNTNLTEFLSGYIYPDLTNVTIPAHDYIMLFFTTPYGLGLSLSPGVHEAIIVGDAPSTKIIEMRAPITIVVPYEFTAENSYKISKTQIINPADIGIANDRRLFFKVPSDAQLIDIEVYQTTGSDVVSDVYNPDGFWHMAIGTTGPDMPLNCTYTSPDNQTMVLYYGMGGPRDRRAINDPEGGIWEIYSSNNYFNSWTWALYADPIYAEVNFNITLYGIATSGYIPEVPYNAGLVVFNYTVNNLYAPIDARVIASGVGPYNASLRNVANNEWYVEEFTVPNDTVILHIEITDPEDPHADLDLYVIGPDGTVYDKQVGPTSHEVFELDEPTPGVYTILVYGWNVPSNETAFRLIKYALRDGYLTSYTPIVYLEGGSLANITLVLNASGEVYPGINIGEIRFVLTEPYIEDGLLEYVSTPVFIKVGGSSFAVGLEKTHLKLGEAPVIIVRDAFTGVPVPGTEVYIDGKYYGVTDQDGKLALKLKPDMLKLGDHTLKVKVIRDGYVPKEVTLTYTIGDIVRRTITESDIQASVVFERGRITSFEKSHGKVVVTVEGESGQTESLIIVLPNDAQNIKVSGDIKHILDYYIEKGRYAQYLIITVQFASSVTIEITYLTATDIISQMNLIWYLMYHRYMEKFNELYNKSIELGIDNEILQEALHYKQIAEQYYDEASEFGPIIRNLINPRVLSHLRKAYLNIRKAVEILGRAIEEAENS